jgi:hypothetical protein
LIKSSKAKKETEKNRVTIIYTHWHAGDLKELERKEGRREGGREGGDGG